jgi:hypothetical protein
LANRPYRTIRLLQSVTRAEQNVLLITQKLQPDQETPKMRRAPAPCDN